MKAINCPSCGAPVEPSTFHCEYCGSYLIPEKDEEDFISSTFTDILATAEEESVICVCGRSLEKGEYPIRSGKANLYRGITNGAGGHLVLTNHRFLFIDHGFNMQLEVKPEEESIYFKDIIGVKSKTVMFISKRLVVEKKDGTQQEYVVWNLNKWMNAIREVLPQI